jgi:hypothetical protein
MIAIGAHRCILCVREMSPSASCATEFLKKNDANTIQITIKMTARIDQKLTLRYPTFFSRSSSPSTAAWSAH